jgi:prepilin-type N-terminal cleavage/methylation domain-containing protein
MFWRCGKSHRQKLAFTLIELLISITIIGILTSILLPVLSQGKNRGMMAVDINNLKEQGTAIHLYASDHDDELSWPNWSSTNIPGWLYTYDKSATGPACFNVQTGVFWSYLHNPNLYRCPMDYTNTPQFAKRPQQISSYVMNGAVIGYNRMIFPPLKLSNIEPEAVSFWEADEQFPNYFNDGASYPSEGVSARHFQGAMSGRFDGSASYIRFDNWYDLADQTVKNELWCYPESTNGR